MIIISKQKKRYVGKIGWCNNSDLNISKPKGHYVIITNYSGKKCDVHTITSLEDTKKNLDSKKMKQLRKGNIYPIPCYDTNFTKWSGITKDPIKNIDLSN